MSLRFKVSSALTITLLGLLLSLSFIYSFFVLKSYENIEQNLVKNDLARVRDAFHAQTDYMSSKLLDWAEWDDTYKFIEDHNPQFIESNINDTSLINLQINAMILVNSKHEVVYEKWQEGNSQINIDQISATNFLPSNTYFLEDTAAGVGRTGIISLPQGTLMLAAHPILTSTSEGPSRGTIIFGKFIDTELVKEIGATTHLEISSFPTLIAETTPGIQPVLNSLKTSNDSMTVANNNQNISGYSLFTDYQNKPALLIKIDEHRIIYTQALESIKQLLLAGALASIIFIIFILIIIDRIILNRLASLSATVEKISNNNDLSIRIPDDHSKDELSILSSHINDFLNNIHKSNLAIQIEQDRLNEKTTELESMNQMMVGRELKMAELKEKLQELEKKNEDTETKS